MRVIVFIVLLFMNALSYNTEDIKPKFYPTRQARKEEISQDKIEILHALWKYGNQKPVFSIHTYGYVDFNPETAYTCFLISNEDVDSPHVHDCFGREIYVNFRGDILDASFFDMLTEKGSAKKAMEEMIEEREEMIEEREEMIEEREEKAAEMAVSII